MLGWRVFEWVFENIMGYFFLFILIILLLGLGSLLLGAVGSGFKLAKNEWVCAEIQNDLCAVWRKR